MPGLIENLKRTNDNCMYMNMSCVHELPIRCNTFMAVCKNGVVVSSNLLGKLSLKRKGLYRAVELSANLKAMK